MKQSFWTLLACTAIFVACTDNDSNSISHLDVEDSSSSEINSSSAGARTPFSSSSKKSSSSVYLGPINLSSIIRTVDPSTVVTDSMTDSRDGQTYRTVSIGSQTWMAQNLNYESANSYCYRDSSKYCNQYGRLYTWAAAMDSASTWSANGKGCGFESTCTPTYPVRGVCPEGWHLPDSTEWMTFINSVGSVSYAGKNLKAGKWFLENYGNNKYHFTVLPSGNSSCDGGYFNESYSASIWSSTEFDNKEAHELDLFYRRDGAYLVKRYKCAGFSVRCLKD